MCQYGSAVSAAELDALDGVQVRSGIRQTAYTVNLSEKKLPGMMWMSMRMGMRTFFALLSPQRAGGRRMACHARGASLP